MKASGTRSRSGRHGKRCFRASNAGAIAGTGFGLHIVHSVARAHQGLFTLRNRPQGHARALFVSRSSDDEAGQSDRPIWSGFAGA
jgi:signal transduction histidine kinase